MTFSDLGLIDPLTNALGKKGYLSPTPIQQQAIPAILEGKDIFGCAQTGTGKTASFALPILQQIALKKNAPAGIRALILAPTRELALQISASFTEYGQYLSLAHTTLYGGVSQKDQVNQLRNGTDILIATPGRLLDLIGQGLVKLGMVEFLVLDEADRMLDMGFINDVKRILRLIPQKRQTFLFSATAAPEIVKLSQNILTNPVHIRISPQGTAAPLVKQSVYHIQKDRKRELLNHVLRNKDIENVIVFTRTKRGADRVAKNLTKSGITAEALHGDKSQNARDRALHSFKNKKIRVLVATDIASRGIDISKLSHVINYELPEQPETYVHRIGRTGRAGSHGIALSFCSDEEKSYLNHIHKLIRSQIEVSAHPF